MGVELLLCQRFLLFQYICLDAGYVRSTLDQSPQQNYHSKSSRSLGGVIERWSESLAPLMMLLQRPSWPCYCVTRSLFTDPILSLKEPLSSHTEWKTAGDLLTARACGSGRGWGQKRMFFLFLSLPPRSPIVENEKKKSVYRLTNMVHNSHKNYSLRSRFTQVPR